MRCFAGSGRTSARRIELAERTEHDGGVFDPQMPVGPAARAAEQISASVSEAMHD